MSIRTSLLGLAVVAAASFAATSAAQAPPALKTKQIATGFSYPTFVTAAPGDSCRLFVTEKKGVIKIIDLSSGTPTVLATPFLNIDSLVVGGSALSEEQGLLGLAFHPDYDTNGYFFVYYTANGGANTLARYQVDPNNPNVALTPGLVLWAQADSFSNHNGGWLGFGPDGYLYVAMGDGGSGNDPSGNGQNLNTKLGKIHRIDPNVTGNSPPYFIPASNPFAGGATTDDTIWAYGMRNPWRCSFDRQTGDFWIGDVGQDAVEEVDFQVAGAPGGRNYGWRCMEGNNCTGLTGCTCNAPTITLPIKTHTHSAGTAGGFCVVGGYVYRGCAIPDLQGFYIYADYSLNNVWAMRYNGGTISNFTVLNSQVNPALNGATVNTVVSFGEDANGELYMVKHGGSTTGTIFKIVPASGEVLCPITGDLNGDGKVDGADLGLVIAGWGTPSGDLNCDRTTDGADLGILIANWTP